MKLLIADDEMDISMLLEMTLMESGHEVTTVGNGREACDAVDGDTFDAILLDANMPEMGGVEAFDILHGEKGVTIPIIFLTAAPEVPDIQNAIRRGAAGAIRKPFNIDTISDEIAAFIK